MGFLPHKTAMARRGESPLARFLYTNGFLTARSILDYGAGRGRDYAYYIEKGIEAYAYDPWKPFGFGELIVQEYDVITCLFVLNVLSTKIERIEVLTKIKKLMHKASVLYLAVRSDTEIEKFAQAKAWPQYSDGYISSAVKKTFQKGFSLVELEELAKEAGFVRIDFEHPLNKRTAIVIALKIVAC